MLYLFHTRPRLHQQAMLKPLRNEVICELVWALTLLGEYGPALFGLSSIQDFDTSGSLCALWGAIGQFAGVASYAWYGVMALNALIVLRSPIERQPFRNVVHASQLLHTEAMVVWSVSILSVLVPAMQGAFGPVQVDDDYIAYSDYQCWIQKSQTPVLGWAINYGVFIIVCVIALALLVQVCATSRLGRDTQLRVMQRTLWFVGLFLVVWLIQHASDFVKWYCLNNTSGGAYCRVPEWLASFDVAISSIAGLLTGAIWLPSKTFRLSPLEQARQNNSNPNRQQQQSRDRIHYHDLGKPLLARLTEVSDEDRETSSTIQTIKSGIDSGVDLEESVHGKDLRGWSGDEGMDASFGHGGGQDGGGDEGGVDKGGGGGDGSDGGGGDDAKVGLPLSRV
mmetsp:Transcript_87016/g.246761  ORF Transcript_87016/g.246761 Transcript_87016/m.246761 type:complete len:394 (-) Transcript_87016:194-1375(-)